MFCWTGKRADKTFAESVNSNSRNESLDQRWYLFVEETRQTIVAWRVEYYGRRPHLTLDQQMQIGCAAA